MRQLLELLKPFRVVCSHGTDTRTWTLKGARSLLPKCGRAAIICKYGNFLELRIND